jgi:hypothetical protein
MMSPELVSPELERYVYASEDPTPFHGAHWLRPRFHVHEWKLDGEAAISATITLAAVGETGAPKPRLQR